jgi:hypothetical protein
MKELREVEEHSKKSTTKLINEVITYNNNKSKTLSESTDNTDTEEKELEKEEE